MSLLGFANPAMWLVNIGMAGLGYLLFRPKRNQATKPVEQEFKLSAVKIGSPIPVGLGYFKTGGLIIEWGDWTVVKHKKSTKGGKM